MDNQYFLKWKNRQFGPFTKDEITAKIRQGAVTAHHLVSSDKQVWTSLKEHFPEAFPKSKTQLSQVIQDPEPALMSQSVGTIKIKIPATSLSVDDGEESLGAKEYTHPTPEEDSLPGARKRFIDPRMRNPESETIKVLCGAMILLALIVMLLCVVWLLLDLDQVAKSSFGPITLRDRIFNILLGCGFGLIIVTCIFLASLHGDGYGANTPLRLTLFGCGLFVTLLLVGVLSEVDNANYYFLLIVIGIIAFYLGAAAAFYAPKLNPEHEWLRTVAVVLNGMSLLVSILVANSIPSQGLIKIFGLLNSFLIPSLLGVFILARIDAIRSAPMYAVLHLQRKGPFIYIDQEGIEYSVKALNK